MNLKTRLCVVISF